MDINEKASIMNRLDEIEDNIMDELKDFQKATVNRIDYLFRSGQNRILVSDEVGLGKTLIARGTIAKFANLRKEEEDDLVKVVYICSNATIAQQNLDKLRIVNELRAEDSNTSRLSMQHLNIFNQENDENVLNRYIQLIPLTPQTSFQIKNSQGTKDERALIYLILKEIPQLKELPKLKEFLKYDKRIRNWRGVINYNKNIVKECNKKSNGEYLKYMVYEATERLNNNEFDGKSLMEAIISHCSQDKLEKWESKRLIIKLRTMFSDISLDKLEPDLIIMDEFQRFKSLINNDLNSEMGILTNKFFNSSSARILMLSATPYKMYSTLDEIDQTQIDSHYKEFFDVINFLNTSDEDKENFNTIWNNYSIELKELSKDKTSFICAKNLAEDAMYKNICRTERITESQVGDIIDDSDKEKALTVFKEDILSYLEVEKLLDEIGLKDNVPIDFVKSSPYLMSFMKHYQLKRKIERYFKNNPLKLKRMDKSTFFLKRETIDNYEKISFNHARLNHLMTKVFDNNAELLLWIPPSKEYYHSEGVFKNTSNFTKTLIFSSWEMVPRMISSLVSYEAERKTIGKLAKYNPKIKYFLKNRYPAVRFRYSLKDGVPQQMNLLSLIYPSKYLSNLYNPIECMNKGLSLEEIENQIKSILKEKIDKFQSQDSIREDNRWYYLAPLLLDLSFKGESRNYLNLRYRDDSNHVKVWFNSFQRDNNKGFNAHFDSLKDNLENVLNGEILGKKPHDLIDILCDLVISSPANCIYRSYQKELHSNDSIENHLYLATEISKSFLNNLNSPESIAVIDLACSLESEEAYWKNVLKYSKQGNLQAVFDEFIHLLSNGLDKSNEDRIKIIHNKFLESMNIRSTAYDVDTFNTFKSRVLKDEKDYNNLRTHFAVSFTKGKSDGKDVNRKKTVRDAFNSPFRPFVLASTSIGQEGLDFHNYCRRIVHWNLPSNPIDLEQREGRINRFECLTIRQNIAKRYGNITFKNNVWKELFDKAGEIEGSNSSDLIPYWGLKDSEDMIKIERIVPMYPFSRDESKYDRLIKILSLYRLTLGQARQEELIDKRFIDLDYEDIKDLFINLSPFYKNE